MDSTYSCSSRIYISLIARKQLFKEINWGANIATNSHEEGGLLIGKPYFDSYEKFYYSIVTSIIPAVVKEDSINEKKYGFDSWQAMLNKLDIYNKNKTIANKEYVVGWYHTHKGNRSVYMSEKDMDMQKMFPLQWQFGIVLNPQKQAWKAFNGKKAYECQGFVLK
ncbi:hypothetical protein [uncultured Kordia sp.]|uniref:hypothetical protein n=1 Tax=uncultured Kordia sp. TaxID=507699 RepID=UPI00262DAAF4|nr:hypothetical protein [uncultured Kordia sp.]